jgi:multisubunit Na+/H+ antiporter MnhE subunit
MKWIKGIFVETLNQTFTLLGFFTAWVLLEGSAKQVIGGATLGALAIWLLSINVREKE